MGDPMEQGNGGLGEGFVSEENRRAAARRSAVRARERQALDLQRESILSQRTSHPARRAALEAALEQIEAQIASLS